jgi:putative membrane protein
MAFALPADYFTSKVEVVEEIQLLPDIIVTENDEKSKTYNDFEEKAEIEKAEIEEAEIEEIEETEAMEEDFSEEIVMTSKNFYKVISEIYSDMNYYNGVSIKTVGFVFKGDGMFEDNQFVPARLMMICCAADMQPVGLLCVYDKALELEEDSWVQVQGTISITEFEGEYVPCIIAEEVKKEDAPDKQYIYPY